MRLTDHFTVEEMTCHCGCGQEKMAPAFMATLEQLRIAYGKPMQVTSGYRCPAHNTATLHTGADGPHTTTGQAVDIAVSGADARWLLTEAGLYGFMGIGVSQKGTPHFLHLDTLTSPAHPRPMIWSY